MTRQTALALLAFAGSLAAGPLAGARAAEPAPASGATYAVAVVELPAGAAFPAALASLDARHPSIVVDGADAPLLDALLHAGGHVLESVQIRLDGGKPTRLESVEEIPYVSGVKVDAKGVKTEEAATVRVGRTLVVTRSGEGDGRTLDLSLKASRLVRMDEFDAGRGTGRMAQPDVETLDVSGRLDVAPGRSGVVLAPREGGPSLVVLLSPA